MYEAACIDACACVFSTCNSWYYWQLAGWRLLLLQPTERVFVCVHFICMRDISCQNDELCTLNEKCVFFFTIHTNGEWDRMMPINTTTVSLSRPRSHFISLLLLWLFYSFVSARVFYIYVCIHFMSLCFIRIVWGHNRTNRRPHHNTHASNNKQKTQTEREEESERIKWEEETAAFRCHFEAHFGGYEFLFRPLSRFITIKAINLILFWVSAFEHGMACTNFWMELPIGGNDSVARCSFMLNFLSFNHEFIWL